MSKRVAYLTESLHVTVDEPTRTSIDRIAQREERSVGAVTRMLLREALAARERKAQRAKARP